MSKKKTPLIFCLFFFLSSFVFAQTVNMSWLGGENASYYQIEIEREHNTGYTSYLTETTTERVFYLTLPPGNYCYRITPYDILERPGTPTEWIYFEVKEREIEIEFTTEDTESTERNYYYNVGAGLMPVIFASGEEDKKSQFFGVVLRASANFPVLENICAGPEASISMTAQNVNVGINARLFKLIPGTHSGFIFRLGAEYLISLDDKKIDSSVNAVAGVSFLWQITPLINAEFGIDLASTMNMPPDGYIRPWIGVGVRY